MRGALPDYPWDAMAPYAAEAARHPDGAVNLSVGSPVDPSPAGVREALAAATDAHAYPATAGTPHLREAISEWFLRRRGVRVAPAAVLPTVGSKELVALLPFLLGIGAGEAVVFPRIAYPSYAMGAALVGAEALASDDPAEWPAHTRLVWVNSPSNPDGRVRDAEWLRAAVTRARELGAVIAGDECYAEFGWDAPWDTTQIPSILDPAVVGDDHTDVLSVYSLSKQSNLAGYRAAFLAGDPELVERLLTVRKHAGLMLPAPVQAAMIAALRDETHVAAQRDRYRARRAVLRPALEAAGFRIEGSEAGLYLWATRGVDAWESVASFAQLGIVVGPGHFYGDHSPQHVRLALTASDADIAAAARRIGGSTEAG
ncbi:succinyldiaminopimelate aminotransferase [Leucobacter luti]|uniref:succinyldiaminopimelate transaminase n=1 Tax=Leucobacter luti TaxID=340320 RepID=UPI001052AC30|nr:succinyldiaminopimelate transaminase [Leucobacter luti]MCW2287389.1 succinyldiaminopimelate transaminase [Leucobacter luti]TCK41611.1 succinyldiaminopimelate aminotransferase [Leucobacter luti]